MVSDEAEMVADGVLPTVGVMPMMPSDPVLVGLLSVEVSVTLSVDDASLLSTLLLSADVLLVVDRVSEDATDVVEGDDDGLSTIVVVAVSG